MEIMDSKEWEMPKSFFSTLSVEHKMLCMALLAQNMTVLTRGVYSGPTDMTVIIKRMTTFNEIVHIIATQLTHMLAKDEKRYKDEDFIDTLYAVAQDGNCKEDLMQAFNLTFTYLSAK